MNRQFNYKCDHRNRYREQPYNQLASYRSCSGHPHQRSDELGQSGRLISTLTGLTQSVEAQGALGVKYTLNAPQFMESVESVEAMEVLWAVN